MHALGRYGAGTIAALVLLIGGLPSPAHASVTRAASTGGVAIYTGYADCRFLDSCSTTGTTVDPRFPNPWAGSAGVTYVGDPAVGTAGDPDISALRIVNNSGAAVTVNDVNVTCSGGTNFDQWGSNPLAAGGDLILGQAAGANFDGSELSCAGEKIVVTVNGTATTFTDAPSNEATEQGTGSVLFPPSASDESEQWAQVGTIGGSAGGSGPPPTRLAGINRLETAIMISQTDFPTTGSAKAVVLARSDIFPDALAGTPLAAHLDAPLLLTPPTALDPNVSAEIHRALPAGGTVYMLGGTSALAQGVQDTLTGLGFTVVRYSGTTRDGTAVAIAHLGLGDPTTILEATGLQPYDALSGGAAAAHIGAAILLTDGTGPSPDTTTYLAAHAGDTRYAIGGPAKTADPAATGISGADRDTTSVLVAQQFFSAPATVSFADDGGFADALSGGPDAARANAPVLLVPTNPPLEASTTTYLNSISAGVTEILIYGGPAAISADQATAIQNAA